MPTTVAHANHCRRATTVTNGHRCPQPSTTAHHPHGTHGRRQQQRGNATSPDRGWRRRGRCATSSRWWRRIPSSPSRSLMWVHHNPLSQCPSHTSCRTSRHDINMAMQMAMRTHHHQPPTAQHHTTPTARLCVNKDDHPRMKTNAC